MGEGKSEKESNYDSIQLFSNDYWTYPSDGSSEKKIIEFVCKSFKD